MHPRQQARLAKMPHVENRRAQTNALGAHLQAPRRLVVRFPTPIERLPHARRFPAALYRPATTVLLILFVLLLTSARRQIYGSCSILSAATAVPHPDPLTAFRRRPEKRSRSMLVALWTSISAVPFVCGRLR